MSLGERVVRVPILGLGTQADPKGSPAGRLDLAENVMATRLDGVGPAIEIVKRNGFATQSRNIQGGGSLSAGAKLAAFGSELVATDGDIAYAWSPGVGKWIKKGFVSDIAATAVDISGNSDTGENTVSSVQMDCDVAYANGYSCHVNTRDPVFVGFTVQAAEWYVREVATGAIVGNGTVNSGTDCMNVRVVAVGTDFFLFYWDGINTIGCKKIATATDPTTFATANVNVATNVNTSGIYDVIADVTNSKILLAYQNTTPTLTLEYWLTNMTAGTTVAYATRNPNMCIGFLDYSFASGNGYVSIGTSVTGVRVLTFPTSTLVVGTDTQVDAAATDAVACTGYFGTGRNVLYTRPGSTTRHDFTSGWAEGTGFVAMRSVSLQSRPFTMDGNKRYVLMGHWEDMGAAANPVLDVQRSLFLMQLDKDTTTRSGVRVAGFLANDDWGAWGMRRRGLGSFAVVSATVAYVAAPGLLGIGPAFNSYAAAGKAYSLRNYELDFSHTKTGAPTAFNGALFFPGAAAKVYDGRNVFENGFYMRPGRLTLAAAGGGSHTAGLVQVMAIYSIVDSTGRLWRSASSDVASVTVTAGQSINITIDMLRVTDRSPLYSINSSIINPQVRLEIYTTKPNGTTFTFIAFAYNDASVDTFAAFEGGDNPGSGEELYTALGSVEDAYPPMANVLGVHRNRLFAISGDGSVWHTQETTEADAAAFAIDFRILFDSADGPLVGLVSDGTTLYATKRSRVYTIHGEGPLRDGSNPYSYPQPLPADAGFAGARALAGTPDGMLIQTAKGFHLLDRAGGIQPVPGADAYENLTVTSGVALDDRPYACLFTSNGTTIVWDWQLKQWYAWTGQAAVSACRWLNKPAFLDSAGKVWVETPGVYADDVSTAIQERVRFTWMNFAGTVLGFQRIWAIQLLGEFLASTTVNLRLAYDLAAALTTYSKAVTASTLAPLEVKPARQECRLLQVTVDESSTTAGFKLSGFVFVAGVDGRIRPVDPAQRMT
jgi:hypothetical protein